MSPFVKEASLKEQYAIELINYIKTHDNINSFLMSNTSVTKKTVQFVSDLFKISTLTSIGLEYNKIDDEVIKCLSESLKTNSTLTSIDLGSNNIGDDGAEDIAEALKINNTLTSIDLLGNNISDTMIQTIDSLIEHNKDLNKKSDAIVENIFNLSQEILSIEKLDPKVQKLVQIKLAKTLPDFLLKVSSEDMIEFNSQNELGNHDSTFTKLKWCLIKVTGNEELIRAIFTDFEKAVIHVCSVIQNIIMFNKDLQNQPIYQHAEVQDLKIKGEFWSMDSDLVKSWSNQPLSEAANCVGWFLDSNQCYYVREKDMQRLVTIVKHHLEINTLPESELEQTEIIENNNIVMSKTNYKDLITPDQEESLEPTVGEKAAIYQQEQREMEYIQEISKKEIERQKNDLYLNNYTNLFLEDNSNDDDVDTLGGFVA